ncbi:MAG: hypothetical protein KDJ25_11040 [Rhodoblastus sp.]|nr:hypothetical protein [Rhodoblastus sp.]
MGSTMAGRARAMCVALAAATLAGCGATERTLTPAAAPSSGGTAALGPPAPTVPADQLVGKWGLGAYHRDSDRPRTEKEARAQCSNPYVIGKGSNGGVIMHVADEKEPEELFLKKSGGKSYLGPPGPAPMAEDREMVSNDGRVMIMRFMDPDVIKRYGTSIYVRCGA